MAKGKSLWSKIEICRQQLSSGPGMAINIRRKSVSCRRLPVFANNNAIEWKSIGALDALIEGTPWSQCMVIERRTLRLKSIHQK
jgi:hypothetical protein